MPTLVADDIHAYYGHIHALHGVSVTVETGEIVTLIGANGAGKSTTLKTIAGFLQPRPGAVRLDGTAIHGLPPHEITRRGICLVPEGRRIFPRMTVLDNLRMGAFTRSDARGIEAVLARGSRRFRRLRSRPGR